jgi:CrcB protein
LRRPELGLDRHAGLDRLFGLDRVLGLDRLRRRRWLRGFPLASVAAVSAGGAAGAVARYLVAPLGGWPWGTLLVNIAGCALIGVLMVLAVDRWPDVRLLRPLLGTGVLGGFTTFSTYAVDVEQLVREGRVAVAVGYLLATPLLAVAAVAASAALTRRLTGWRSM